MSRPVPRHLRRALLAGGVLAGLAVPSVAFAADPASTAIVLTKGGGISTFETAFPAEATAPTAVTGLTAGDRLVAIDVRPQNGYLYGLGRNATAGTLQLYGVSPVSAVATPIGTPVVAGGTVAETEFGFDFNPTVDRIRVTSDAGLNLRLNPNDGTVAATDPVINGGTTKIDGAAYTNDQQNATATTLYGLDASTGRIHRSTDPNAGTYAPGRPITAGGTAVPLSAIGGFDIAPGTNVAAPNDEAAAGGVGFAAVKVGTANVLLGIELATGNSAVVGPIGNGGTEIQGLAIQQEVAPGGLPAITSSATQLRRFNTSATSLPDTPAAGTSATVTGITAGETLVGVDYRPSTGQLVGLGVNATADTATLYRIDPQSGIATALSPVSGAIAFTTDGVAAVDLPDPATAGYDIDFNPTVDRVRVVTSTGLNFRVNPATGAPVDGDNGAVLPPAGTDLPVAGTNPDGAQNAATADIGTDVSGTGYTNSFAPATGSVFTTQYGISAGKDQLLIQNPPNKGTQTTAKPLGLDVTSVRGFDVPRSVRVTASNTPATGTGLAVLGTGTSGTTGLYGIDLATGAATLKTTVVGTSGFAVGDGPPAAKVRTPAAPSTPATPTTPARPTTPATPTTPARPTTPTAAARINLRRVNARATRKGRRYTTTGSLTFRTTSSAADRRRFCAKGTVSIQIRAGRRTISTRRVTLKSNCTFSSTVTFSSTRRFGGRSRLSFAVKFNGTAFVLPRRASTFSVRTR